MFAADDIQQATNPDRYPLVNIALEKCLNEDPKVVRWVSAVQGIMNELQRLANMGVTSMMDATATTQLEAPKFHQGSLRRLWIHFQEQLDWHGPVGLTARTTTSDAAPMLERAQFIEIASDFFKETNSAPQGGSSTLAREAIDPEKEKKAAARVQRTQQLGALYDQIDRLNALGRLDLRDVFVQLSKGVPTMNTADRLSFFWNVYQQPGKREGKAVVDYVDIAQLLERGAVELRNQSDILQAWCAESSVSGQCSGDAMLKASTQDPAIISALARVLMC